MKIVYIRKAQATGDIGVESLRICFELPIQTAESLGEAREHYQEDGAKLGLALLDVLPGGTADALLVELLTHRASLLSVKF
jgi:hypothetical protein